MQREKQDRLRDKEKEAQTYANKIKKMVVLYFDENNKAAFIEAETAKSQGIDPVKYIPYLPGADDE